jgi:hypothetical protein
MLPQTELADINHFIDRAEARKLVDTFEAMKYELINPSLIAAEKAFGVLPESEAFNEKSILAILAQKGCTGIRIHYGIKNEQRDGKEVPLMVAVLVGVDEKGENMWGSTVANHKTFMATTDREAGVQQDGVIVEDSQRCPPFVKSTPAP